MTTIERSFWWGFAGSFLKFISISTPHPTLWLRHIMRSWRIVYKNKLLYMCPLPYLQESNDIEVISKERKTSSMTDLLHFSHLDDEAYKITFSRASDWRGAVNLPLSSVISAPAPEAGYGCGDIIHCWLDFSFLTNSVDVEKQKDRLVELEKQLAAAAGVRDGELRLWLSAGPGNLGVTAAGCQTSLYIICFKEDWPKLFSQKLRGISEFTVSPKYPVKNKVLATMKSTNYLINALGATESTGKGGNFGIWVDPVTDRVYESSVCNVVFVLQDGSMVTPPFIDGDILKGCTVRRIVELARKHLVGNLLQKVVTDEEVYRGKLMEVGIKEMFLTSGDLFVDPITRWDDLVLQEDATPGPVVTKLIEILYEEAVQGDTEYHEKINYNSISTQVEL